MSLVSMLSTGRTVPPTECFYSYERCSSIGVLERFVFTGRMPFLTPNEAHQMCAVCTSSSGESVCWYCAAYDTAYDTASEMSAAAADALSNAGKSALDGASSVADAAGSVAESVVDDMRKTFSSDASDGASTAGPTTGGYNITSCVVLCNAVVLFLLLYCDRYLHSTYI